MERFPREYLKKMVIANFFSGTLGNIGLVGLFCLAIVNYATYV